MKIPISILVFLAFIVSGVGAQSPTTQSQITVPIPTPYAVANQYTNSQVWQRQGYEAALNGQIIKHFRTYNEITTGGRR
jgi:hypothetical protein